MATKPPVARPLSPHVWHVRWPITMTVSIVHRATGDGMATVGTGAFVWWLAALAGGKDSYATFLHVFTQFWGGAIGYVVGIGLTLSFFQHMATGIRHFLLDTGAGYELKSNRIGAWLTVIGSVTLTAAFWLYLLGGK
ncbi:succinate dehydrogenase, cytochrome b556 subunit [Sphingomonas alpina]|uniref:Succinate dehydrogenase cytochrome b556 subunit n=1 Tax=Sphingomonas alpina TaxID=653931 RepID=A0A7H0LDZ3_9SPHN|nr:succinate dehydrogenase, cytochrome b556 subunit [Sphingomonas alpina]QNQ07896.1 succinate dehydrogenase, cytochrome b556 subunit [Sphingomonas alpina]